MNNILPYAIFENAGLPDALGKILCELISNDHSNILSIIEQIIILKPNLNYQNNIGNTSLILSVLRNKINIVKVLVEAGADLNIKNDNGETALLYSINDKISSLLVKAGADVNIPSNYGETAIMRCVHTTDTKLLKQIIKAGANLNAQNREGDTALFGCTKFEPLIELITAGADMKIKNKKGNNFIDNIFDTSKFNYLLDWFSLEEAQKLILSKEPSLIKSFIDNNINIHPNIKKQFPKYSHLFSGKELNLL